MLMHSLFQVGLVDNAQYERMIVFETEMKQHAQNGQWYEAWLVSIT